MAISVGSKTSPPPGGLGFLRESQPVGLSSGALTSQMCVRSPSAESDREYGSVT